MVAPQGAGKGTQADRLAAHYGIEHISSGDLLRTEVAKGTEVGRAAKEYLDQGDLVPDDVILQMMVRRLMAAAARGFVLDGWPRTIHQALALDDLVGDLPDVGLQAAINLDVPPDELRRRLLDRAGSEGRSDDTDSAIEHRLSIYERETRPLLDYYGRNGVLVVVDGNQPPDAVTKDLIGQLDACIAEEGPPGG
jgi:adenylate kinase